MATIPPVSPVPGELMRFRVASRSKAGVSYLVDLAEYGRNGRCNCEDFECRRWPLIRDGGPKGESTRCIHIRQAREFVLDLLLGRIEKM